MSLKQQLQQDLKDAMRAKDKPRLSTIRLLLAAIKNAEIDAGHPLEDTEAFVIVERQIKQRRDAAAEFSKGGRNERAEEELAEMAILQTYLPPQLSKEEITRLANDTIREVGAQGPADLGKVMKLLMPQVRGKAEGKVVNRVVRELLSEKGSD